MKRNPPFPDGQAVVTRLLQTCPEFGSLAAAGGSNAIWVFLKAAPKKPGKPSLNPPHLNLCKIATYKGDDLGSFEAAKAPKASADPLFKITLSEAVWSRLTPRGREAGLYSALMRCHVVENDSDDSEDTGYTCTVLKYPIQTFQAVLDKYGRWEDTELLDPPAPADSDEDEIQDSDDPDEIAATTLTRTRRAKDLNPDAIATGSDPEDA